MSIGNRVISQATRRPYLFLWLVGVLINIISFLLIWFKVRHLSAQIILHYNVVIGADLLGPGATLYRLPALGLGMLVVDGVLVNLFVKRFPLIAQLAVFVGVLMSLLVLIALLFIFSANG